MRHVRQALVPGVFFGLNLAIFFAGATHNSVANAALIGSLAPFLIVPIGARLFGEFNDPRALVFALLAFGGVGLVLFSAPATGDASLQGNVFGFVAMLLLVGFVVSTRHFRRDMDVAVFMATICPIAALAVLPMAVANGDVFGMSGKGWIFTLILTFLSGVAANGLMVYAQKTIQIGTIVDRAGRQAGDRGGVVVPAVGRDGAGRAGRRHRDRDRRAGGVPLVNQRGEQAVGATDRARRAAVRARRVLSVRQ